MESVDAKMIRALEHLQTLGEETTAFLKDTRDKTKMIMVAPPGATPCIRLWGGDHIPPIRLSVLVGDCIHNMRSALDNLVCGLVRTKDPSCECEDTDFPICTSETAWDKKVKRGSLTGVPPDAVEIIREVQPWRNPGQPNPLVWLQNLNNRDKHRGCNFTLAYNRNIQFVVHTSRGPVFVPAGGKLYLGSVHDIPLPIDPRIIPLNPRVETTGTATLAFQGEEELEDIHGPEVLRQCFNHVEKNVISRLTIFFNRK
jgi:hypothetical protein